MQAEDQNREATNREDATRERSFDELAKELARGTISRLHALRFIGGALLGGLLALIPGVSSAQSIATADDASIATADDTMAVAQEEEEDEEPGAVAEPGPSCPPECLPTRFYVLSETLTTGPGAYNNINVWCDPGDRVLNGGYQIQGDLNYTIERDIVFTETDNNGVITQRYAFGLVEQSDTPRQVFIEVVCADLGHHTKILKLWEAGKQQPVASNP